MVAERNPVDLRSDTVTRPTAGMRQAMAEATVGDDVYREDPTINRLEEKTADLLGMEAALYVPSGTMGNQLCVQTHTIPGDDIIVHEDAHVMNFEGGSAGALAGVQMRALPGRDGIFEASDVRDAVRPRSEHFPWSRLLCLENTHNAAGGTIWPLERMREVCEAGRKTDLGIHLDGARLWNAHVATGVPLDAYASLVDSVSVCFSKGLGAPIGSALAGSRDFVEKARYHRKRYGGGMRQVGILGAACLYALDNHIERLGQDHAHAVLLAEKVAAVDGVVVGHPVETNIVIADVGGLGSAPSLVVEELRREGVLAGVAGSSVVRFVTHLDVDREAVEWAADTTARVLYRLSSRMSGPGSGAPGIG